VSAGIRERPGAESSARPRTTWQDLDTAVVAAVVVLTIAAEIAVAAQRTVLAAVLDAAAIVLAVNGDVIGQGPHVRRGALGALALVPLARLLSLGMAVEDPVVSLSAAGAPMLLATVLAARTVGVDPGAQLRGLGARSQWPLALAGLAAGGVGAALFRPQPLIADPGPLAAAAALLAVFVFAGVFEELLFRGVLQSALRPVGRWPAPVATVLFASLYLDAGWTAAGAAAVGGSAAAWWVSRTRSLAGVAVAHGMFAAGFLVGWPLLYS